MTDIFKFVATGDTIDAFKFDDGEQEVVQLRPNQTLSLDAATGDVTLTTTLADKIAINLFQQTADTTDDASLYVSSGLTFTTLDGTPIVPAGGHGGQHGDSGVSDDQDLDGNPNDHIRAGNGGGEHHGGGGNDHVDGGKGDDSLYGDDGNDHVSGGNGNDTVHGGLGDDVLAGGIGADTLSGDDGNDIEQGGAGDDTVSGGAGTDLVGGGAGDDTLSGDTGNDVVRGGQGDDTISGGSGNDKTDGGLGADTLSGDDGNDIVSGGAGDDDVSGGAGRDVLFGGLGADTFVFADGDFASATRKGADVIRDFSHEQGDHIDLTGVDADVNTDGVQGFSFVGTAAFSGAAGELRYEVHKNHAFVSGDTNGDGSADFVIRLDHVPTLDAGDFVL